MVNLTWAARTRDIAGPGAAIKAIISFPGAGINGADVFETVFRPEGAGAVTKSYTLSHPVKPGVHLLKVDFIAGEESDFSPLATATLNVKVGSDGTLKRADGTPLGTVTADSAVTQIDLVDGQTVDAGETTDLMVTANATGDAVVALEPGSATFAVTAGTEHLRVNADGTVTGLSEGEATVVPMVDGKSGAPVIVHILNAPLPVRTIGLTTADLVFDPGRQLIWASIAPGIGAGNAVRSIDPATGLLGPAIAVGSDPTVLALSDDGTSLYVGLRGVGAIRRVNLTTNTAAEQFAIPDSGIATPPLVATDLAVQPGSPQTIAVVSESEADGTTLGPVVLDSGVARPNRLGVGEGNRLVWTTANRIVAYDSTSGTGPLIEVAVNSNGAMKVRSVADDFDGDAQRIVRAGGRLYSATGSVIDESTLNRLGAFTLTASPGSKKFYGPSVDSAAHRAYFIEITDLGCRLHAFDTDSFLETANRRIGDIGESPEVSEMTEVDLVRWGNAGLAFRTKDQVIFIDNVSGL